MSLNFIVDSRDVKFVLFEMLKADKLTQYSKFADFDRDMFEDVLELAEKIAVEQVYPINAEGDKEGLHYNSETKEVVVPECYRPALAAYNEAGFISLSNDPEIGGMGMPEVIFQSCTEYFSAAGTAFSMYPMLTVGAANLIKNFGTEEQKKLYLGKMMSGEWGGTMCLTEPEAGTDVGALKTKAVKQDDGTYLISGQKIFISAGDNNLYENIIHPVLARIEGDPPGTKGISVFIVPKYLVNSDGTNGERNDLVCSGIEHKMGIHASPTCTLNFGDNNSCVGYLLGEQRKGMRIMFRMMNEARLFVGCQGLGVSSTAYMHAITYSKGRKQMTHVTQAANPDAPKVSIVQHPDIQRSLLWMKTHVEAMRMLTYYVACNIDLQHAAEGQAAEEAAALVDFLIPITKAGNTDLSWLITAEAIQVYGGYGYCSDYPVEQFARDSKILSLYEGTNGIQSIDLAGRKLLLNKEQYNYGIFKKRIGETIEKAKGVVDERYISIIEKGIEKMDELIDFQKEQMGAGKIAEIFANATPLLAAFRMLTHAWLHLWSLAISLPGLEELIGDAKGADRDAILKENREAAFYSGKVFSSQFFLGAEFQKYFGHIGYILSGEAALSGVSDETFTGAPEE